MWKKATKNSSSSLMNGISDQAGEDKDTWLCINEKSNTSSAWKDCLYTYTGQGYWYGSETENGCCRSQVNCTGYGEREESEAVI
ncbi:predicted protein [Plenodomus lingam JN3]|uniref:Predicted protein n=1 Tax=Leptosphaeria maculans (strain JN3 / isolate v23.1.3 / race Av1-4-5-6-7-8) TaxID=985895 RepID=E4ZI34_LEPMJ|nr:predicted protein [Plenodomus lingam JN3]CBX91177.1 predicted protein [Plenodomus lingam JN3]